MQVRVNGMARTLRRDKLHLFVCHPSTGENNGAIRTASLVTQRSVVQIHPRNQRNHRRRLKRL